ncbi:MAG: zinc ribbon domain-containing protein [Eubacteriales bacterium]|nr:zinc ribbon domain-containing protein [Eubacteriales bacterium]
MYCRKCGNKTGDTDHYCQVCGTPTGYEEPTAAPAETNEMKEEIVFNPPYENKSHFVKEPLLDGEEPSEPKEEEEALKEFISEDEIEAHKEKERETVKPDSLKDSEFTWNIYEFPSSKKTEEIEFNWSMEDFSRPPESKEAEPTPFEEEFFQEIREDSSRIKDQNIDRFFTFSRKNEEFQELLDKEYDKLNTRSEPDRTEKVVTEPEAPEEAAAPEEVTPKSEQISEMARARAQFFGEELIRDNESIKKKLKTETEEEAEPEQAAEPEPVPMEEPAPESEPEPEAGPEPEAESEPLPQTYGPEPEAESELLPQTYGPEPEPKSDDDASGPVFAGEAEQEEEERHKRGIGQILLTILAVILFVEIVILGIRYFAPDSVAAKAIDNTQTQIFKTLSGWSEGINVLFSGNDSNEDEGIQEEGDTGQDNTGQDEPSVEQPDDPETDNPVPDPNPTADKNALISSQMGNNINIIQVKANEALTWQTGKNYGQADINNSKPISNNIWQTPENGAPVYYDKSIVGTIIAFDSQWIDYVNEGNKSVLDLVKKDSKAYQNAVSYSRVGKIKETFQLLEIGEIRQGSKGFYVWVHEELQIMENGTSTDKRYNWIYYLEPSDGKMQIVNYFKF